MSIKISLLKPNPMIRKSLLTVLLITAVFVSHGQTADEILAKYLENTGGVEKWKAIKTIKTEGKATFPQGEIAMTIYRKAPNKAKSVMSVQGKEIITGAYDGTTAWSLNPFAGGTDPVKLDAEAEKDLEDQFVEDSFIDYKKKGHAVTLEGKEEIEGVQCYKIKLEKNKNNDKEDVTEIFYFDSENYVPIMRKSFGRSGPQKGMEMQSYLSDYQEVSGLMVPFAIEQRIAGQSFKVAISKITINENIDDSVFAFPKK
jgi:outer membrane lipoprotein-sorting protein